MKKNERSHGRSMRKRRLIVIIFLLFAVIDMPLSLSAEIPQRQTYLIKGCVTDINGVSLPGVTIRLEGASVGMASDNEGKFILNLPQASGKLIFSFVGYKTLKVTYKADVFLNARMEEAIAALDEVQVVAYGSQLKRDAVGSVASIRLDNALELPAGTMDNLLQGRMAGVNVDVKGGEMGRGSVTKIRGTTGFSNNPGDELPLYVVDGVPMDARVSAMTGFNPLAELNPSDIESVSVLKDASAAAMYGSRAANGVIIITTRKGKYNQRAAVTASISHGITFRPYLPVLHGGNLERRLRLEALANYSSVLRDKETGEYRYPVSYEDAYRNNVDYNYFWNKGNGRDVPVLQDSLNSYYRNSTNLYDYYFQTSHKTDANLKVTGGSERVNYSLGLGYYDAEGILIRTGMKRASFLSNLGIKPVRNLEIKAGLYLAYVKYKRADLGQDLFHQENNNNLEQIPALIFDRSTLLPGPGHPVFEELIRKENSVQEKNNSYNFRGTLELGYTLFHDLTFRVSGAVNYSQQNLNVFKPSDLDAYGETYSYGGIQRKILLMNENLLSWRHVFAGLHDVEALAGFSLQSDEASTIYGYGKNAPSNLIHYVTWNGKVYNTESKRDLKDFLTNLEESTMVGLFARLNYNYRHRYFVSVSVRRDASSIFGEKVRWGTFPSYAVGYTFTEEPWMAWIRPVVDYGKLRLSYGKTGRHFNDPYIAGGKLQISKPFLGHLGVEPELFYGLSNSRLTWEETGQWNVGADVNLFGSRVKMTADYYYRYTDKLLFDIVLPGNHNGYVNQWQNAYAISNEGVEFQFSADVLRRNDWEWKLEFNIAKNWNRLEKSTNKRDFQNRHGRFTNNLSIIGKPLNGIYVYQDKGIYQDQSEVPYYWQNGKKVPLMGTAGNQFYRPGDRRLTDTDGNGQMGAYLNMMEDRVYAGSPLPLVNGGINSELKWKNFDLSCLFNFVLKRHILNTEKASWGTGISAKPEDMARPVYGDIDLGKFWKYPGDKAVYPANRAEAGLLNFATNIMSNVENVSYISLKSLVLGYTLPAGKAGVGMRFFVSGQNLFTLTNYSGGDPLKVPSDTGVDSPRYYPTARVLSLGVSFILK